MHERSILLVITAVTVTGILGNTLISPAIPDILDDFGIGDRGAGALIAATSLPGVFLAPIIGLLADRHGRRNVLVPCLTIFGLAGVAAASAPSFGLLLAARFAMGIGAAGLINLAIVLIGDHWEGADRTRLIGRNTAVLTAGLAVLPPIGGVLTDLVSWRLALAPYGLALVTAAFAWRVLEPGAPDTTVSVRRQLRGIGTVARRPQLLVVFGSGSVVFMLIFGIFLATLPVHLEQEFGIGASMRGLFLAIPALPSIVIALNLRKIRARLGTRPLLVAATVTMTLGFLLIAVSPTAGLIVVGAAIYGFSEGALIPTLQDLAVTLAPPEHRGAVVALFVSGTRFGQTVGSLGAAAIFAATTTFTALWVGVALAAGLAVVFAAAPLDRRNGQ